MKRRRTASISRWSAAIITSLLIAATDVAAAEKETEYRLGPEDVVRIQVWNRPDLTGEVALGHDGKLLVALLGEVDAAGRTPSELAEELAKRYRILDPGIREVLVRVVRYNSRSVTVVGEVRAPARYGFREIPDLWEVVLQAGGATPTADLTRVQIVRRDIREGEPRTMTVDLSSILEGSVPDSLPSLRPGDTVSVPSTTGAAVTPTGSTFQILGSVRNPGIYGLSRAETLAEALAVSGGPLPDANLREVHLTRSTPRGVVAYRVDLRGLLYEGKTVSNLTLKEGDTVTIPPKHFGAGTVARGLVLFLPLITSLSSLIIVIGR